MAQCNNCDKSGFFLKVNLMGMCKDCERISKLQQQEQQALKNIAALKDKLQIQEEQVLTRNKEIIDELHVEERRVQDRILTLKEEVREKVKSIDEMIKNKEILYNEIAEKAKQDALIQIKEEISEQNIILSNIANQIELKRSDLGSILEECDKAEKSTILFANKLRKMHTMFKGMEYSAQKFMYDDITTSDMLGGNYTDEVQEILSNTIKLKLHLMDIRDLRKLYNQNNKIFQDVLVRYKDRYTTKANASIYRLMVIALEAELQNVLYNLKYSKLERAVADIKTITAKYQKIAIEGNQNIAPTVNKFIGEIEYLFIEAIKIEYEYYIQKERIKEEQKAIRERMRQEAIERKLLEEERIKVAQEEEKYKSEILNIQEQLNATTDTEKIQQLEERILKVQVQLGDVEKKKEDITKLQNGQAGYIYIISNLGSFGDKTFKVGMTRRLDPQERVDELGDASVPFKFDVHSFIFSNKATELENQLHKRLNSNRINKVNLRKEFFNTSIDELEELVYSLEPTAEFNRTMLADQYIKSMAVDEIPESVDIIDDENLTDDEEKDLG